MSQVQIPLDTLSIRDGVASSDSPFIAMAGCDGIGARGVNSFFAILEPLSAHVESVDLAPLILDRLQQELATRNKVTATAAISASVEAVNEELHAYNQQRPEADRLFYGLTCGISRGSDLYLAQVAPSQILIAQDGELFAFPGLESWHWSQRSDSKLALEQPLGLHSELEPDLFHTRIEAGDLIVLCSGSLARVIQREPQHVFLKGDVLAVTEHLRELADAYNVDNGTSAAISVHARSRPGKRGGELAFLRQASEIFASLLPEETADRIRRRTTNFQKSVDLQTESVQTMNHGVDSADDNLFWAGTISHNTAPTVAAGAGSSSDDEHNWDDTGTDVEYWYPEHEPSDPAGGYSNRDSSKSGEGKRTVTEIVLGALLALSAAVVGVWQLTVNRDRTTDGPSEQDSVHGLPRLQRYDNSYSRPDFSSVRSRLPRAPISKFTGFVSVGLIIAVAGGLLFSIQHGREQERVEQFESIMQQAVAARTSAATAGDPTVAESFLQASEARLGEAEALGLEPDLIESERAAIIQTRDEALGIERIGNIQVLGGIPAAPEGVGPNLFLGNGQLYVFTDALYQLDVESNRLIRLLAPGDQVGGQPVGELQAASWGFGGPVAMDGLNHYTYDAPSHAWTRHSLGTFGEPYSDVAAMSGYIGNLYLLTPGTGQIIRYHSGQFDALPEDWAGGIATEQLRGGVDMIIDGRIYVLTADGTVLNFYRNTLDDTIAVHATPVIENAIGFSFQPERSYMYIADAHDRILRVNQSGAVVQQFMVAEDAPQIRNIQQLAVDDALGVAYVLTDNALFHVRLPGPPR